MTKGVMGGVDVDSSMSLLPQIQMVFDAITLSIVLIFSVCSSPQAWQLGVECRGQGEPEK